MTNEIISDLAKILRDTGLHSPSIAATMLELMQDQLEEGVKIIIAQREWIDAVPADTQLPSMPGHDRDWVDVFLFKHGSKP